MRFSLATMARRVGRRRSTALAVITPTQALADQLARVYMRVVKGWQAACTGRIIAAYETSLAQTALRDGMIRDDAVSLGGSVDGAGEGLLRLILDLIPELQQWIIGVERWHRGRWTGAALTASGVDLTTMLGPADVRETLESVLASNVALIRDVSEQARGRIAGIVLRGLQERRHAREVAKELREAVGLSRRRSLLIASDQVSKLSARLDQERQQQAGIDQFRYRHSGKLHPRPKHRARDGKLYDWASRKEVGGDDVIAADDMPGIPPYCGCRAQAYLNLDA